MLARRGTDGGSTHVLEATVMASVMVASVAFVVTFDMPSSTASDARRALTQRVADALAILNDTPVEGSPLGQDELSVGLMTCLQADCSRLRDKLDGLFADSVRYAVYLSTPDGLYPVYAPWSPSGEAVTASRLVEPSWNYLFLAVAQSIVNPIEDPLVVYGMPVYGANALSQGASTLSVFVMGNRTVDNAFYIMKGSATTRAVGPGDEPSAAGISVFFHAGDGAALASRDVRATTLSAGSLPSGAPVTFSLRVRESGGGTVPAGTIATVHVPHGWTAVAQQAANDPAWVVLANATDRNGSAQASSVMAKLRNTVSSGSVDLVFQATYAGDANDYYPFSATLSSGAYAEGEILVRGDAHATQPPYEVARVMASVPRPLGSQATTTWTLSALSSEAVGVTRVEIASEADETLFASVTGISGGGTWSTNGRSLVWTGGALLAHDSPLNLTFAVTSTTLSGTKDARGPFVPSVDFGTFTGRLLEETSPGLYRGVFLPESGPYRGYDTTISGGIRSNHSLASAAVYRTTALPGNLNYTVGPAASMKDSLSGADVIVGKRTVAPGETVPINVEVQSVVYQVGPLGLEPSIDINVYPPWSGDLRVPVTKAQLYNGTSAKGAGSFLALLDTNGDSVLDPTTIGRLSTSVDVPKGWLYGPYIVEVDVTWIEDVGTPPASEVVVRHARVFDYFIVAPASGALLSSPVYDVQILAWHEDWG